MFETDPEDKGEDDSLSPVFSAAEFEQHHAIDSTYPYTRIATSEQITSIVFAGSSGRCFAKRIHGSMSWLRCVGTDGRAT